MSVTGSRYCQAASVCKFNIFFGVWISGNLVSDLSAAVKSLHYDFSKHFGIGIIGKFPSNAVIDFIWLF